MSDDIVPGIQFDGEFPAYVVRPDGESLTVDIDPDEGDIIWFVDRTQYKTSVDEVESEISDFKCHPMDVDPKAELLYGVMRMAQRYIEEGYYDD
jgi:hypothetical protein